MRKENLILGGIFIVLLILAFAFEPMMAWKKNLSRPDNFLSDINFEKVDKINIEKDGKKITLERQGDKWKIAGTKDFFVSDKEEIFTTYIEEAIKANFDLVSNNKDKKADYETDKSGARVSFESDNKKLVDFIVGKMTNDFAGSYVSLPDAPETYKVDANLGYALNKDVNLWYDTKIFADKTDKVDKIRFQYPNSEFSVEKVKKADNQNGEGDLSKNNWKGTLPYSFNVDSKKIEKIIALMTGLNAVEIPPQTFEGTGLENHSIIVEISGDGIKNFSIIP